MNIFTLFGEIAVNNAQANQAITNTTSKAQSASKKMEKSFEAIGKAAKKCGKAIAAGLAVGGAAMTALLKNSIGEYAEYEQLVGGVKKLFGDNAGEIMKFANQAYKTAGMSANDYMTTVTTFSASLIKGLGGDTEKAAQLADMAITDMADNANTFGVSMDTLQDAYKNFARQNYTMLDSLSLGYGGTAEGMAQLINDSGVLGSAITVTADTVNQVSFDKIIQAINVIQSRMEITGTTAKEASGTIAGSFAMFKASWTNLLTGLANEDSDMDTLIEQFIGSTETMAANVAKVFPRIKQTIGRVATSLMDEVRTRVSAGWNNTVWPFIRDQMRIRFGIDLPEDWSTVTSQITAWWQDVTGSLGRMFELTVGLFTPDADGNGRRWSTALIEWFNGITAEAETFAVAVGLNPPTEEEKENIRRSVQEFLVGADGQSGLAGLIANAIVLPFDLAFQGIVSTWEDFQAWLNRINEGGNLASETYQSSEWSAGEEYNNRFWGYSQEELAVLQEYVDAVNAAREAEQAYFDSGFDEEAGLAWDEALARQQQAFERANAIEELIANYNSWRSGQAVNQGRDLYLDVPLMVQEGSESQMQSELDDMNLSASVDVVPSYSSMSSGWAYSRDDGSFANGLFRVPYDGFQATLHKDEAVLNRIDASEWRTANAHGYGADTSRLESLMSNMINVMQQVVANTGAGNTVVLDTGVIVGQLAPGIDRQLGSIANRRGRG